MDDNKDLKTPENPGLEDSVTEDTKEVSEDEKAAAEETAADKDYSLDDFDEDKAAEKTEEELDSESELNGADNDSEFDGADDDSEYPVTEDEPENKKPLIQKTIIISLVIVIIAAIAALVITLFFSKDVTGTWRVYVSEDESAATSDEASATETDFYFTFNSDKTLIVTNGTLSGKGTYEIGQNEEGQSVVKIDTIMPSTQGAQIVNSEYTYTLDGNIFTGKTLNMERAIQSYTGATYTEKLELKTATYKAPELEREGDFEKNEDILGEWKYNTDTYSNIYRFNEDGTFSFIQKVQKSNTYMGMQLEGSEDTEPKIYEFDINGIYNVKDDTFTLSYYFYSQSDMEQKFKLDGDILYINGIPFTRDGSATIDEAQLYQSQQQQAQQEAQQQQQAAQQGTQQAAQQGTQQATQQGTQQATQQAAAAQ